MKNSIAAVETVAILSIVAYTLGYNTGYKSNLTLHQCLKTNPFKDGTDDRAAWNRGCMAAYQVVCH